MPQLEPSAHRASVRIHFVRHGETDWSLSGRHTGRTDIALTAHGEDEALALAPELGAVRFAHVFTSSASRARRTCALAGLAAMAEILPDLAEWDYGDYEGRLSADIVEDSPDWSVYRDGCPGGESPSDVSGRADRVIARLRTLNGDVALFSHGQFGCCLAARWIGLPVLEAQHFQLDPASVSILGWNPKRPGLAVIARWNAQPGETGCRADVPGHSISPRRDTPDRYRQTSRCLQRWASGRPTSNRGLRALVGA